MLLQPRQRPGLAHQAVSSLGARHFPVRCVVVVVYVVTIVVSFATNPTAFGVPDPRGFNEVVSAVCQLSGSVCVCVCVHRVRVCFAEGCCVLRVVLWAWAFTQGVAVVVGRQFCRQGFEHRAGLSTERLASTVSL
jgi:hypothetical protein